MKMQRFFPMILCVFCLCACGRHADSPKLYNPGLEPLSADELASLLNVYHWKITQTPNDGKPYSRVRIVVVNHGSSLLPVNPTPPPVKTLASAGTLGFQWPVASDGNPDILLGLKIENDNLSGKLSKSTPGKGATAIQIQLDHLERFGIHTPGTGMNICTGTVWKDNRIDLIDYRDANFQPVCTICLEFLHADPQ